MTGLARDNGTRRVPVDDRSSGCDRSRPVGLTTALALAYYNIPFIVFEANAGLSTETKAGTTLTRTLEIWQRFGAASSVLAKAMRVDEIGDIDAPGEDRDSVKLHLLRDETRFPFVINLPQHDMEPARAIAWPRPRAAKSSTGTGSHPSCSIRTG